MLTKLRAIAEDDSGDIVTRVDRFHATFTRDRILAMLDVIEAADAADNTLAISYEHGHGQRVHAALARLKEME